MKNKILQRVTGTFLGLLMLIGGTQILVSGQDSAKVERTLEGVWQTLITPRNCQTGEQVAPSFRGLLTFHADGTLAEANTSPGQSLRTAGHGIWKRERGWSDYSFAFMIYRFNPDGSLAGSQVIRQNVMLGYSGDNFTTTGTIEISDVNGNIIINGCTTSTGVRFE